MQKVEDNIYVLVLFGTVGTLVLVIAFILLYIKHQKKILRQHEKMRRLELDHQHSLLSAAIQSQENERKRIGQDLHDDVGAALSGLKFSIDMYDPAKGDDSAYSRHVMTCKAMIDRIIQDVRHISHHLSPASLHFRGLLAALESHFNVFNESGGIRVEFSSDARESTLEALDIQTATAIYRVVEELLNNTVKHSGADTAYVDFHEDAGTLVIRYSDNGKGLPELRPGDKRGIGFYSMESRLSMIGATHEVGTMHPHGFSMLIRCPLA